VDCEGGEEGGGEAWFNGGHGCFSDLVDSWREACTEHSRLSNFIVVPTYSTRETRGRDNEMTNIMTTIRTAPRSTNAPRLFTYAAVLTLLFLSARYFSSPNNKLSKQPLRSEPASSVHSMMAAHKEAITSQTSEAEHDPMKVTSSSVSYLSTSLEYYHCGPHPDDSTTELVLMHGAAFTKEDWKTSGVLEKFCDLNNDEEGGDLTLTALDLPVSADGKELEAVYDALVAKGVLSGRPVVVLTPSASGKAVVSLAQMSVESKSAETIQKILKGWIPVAPPSVLQSSDEIFSTFTQLKIPVLSIHGDQDAMGKKVTDKLVRLISAKWVELEGRHPVYLDSPDEFVQEILQFLEEEEL
jgi:pimeloyl-ACP methyl ester carboxylesterase